MASIFAYEHTMLAHQRAMKKAVAAGDSPVQKFYEGSVVFVTGGSGFLGKLLIEKLLRICAPSKIYVLVRHKKGKSPKERLVEVLKDPLFDELRKERSSFDEIIFPVQGDVSELKLGLNDADRTKLNKEVNVIFHLAANVRFDVELKAALLSNARGTREALHLAGECAQLRSFVYVSTAYTHATRDRIDGTVSEVFYDVPVPPDAIIKLAESMCNEKINEIKSTIIDGWPNTYTFSKAIAEEIIRTNSMNIPICVVRPAIVTCTYRDPVPGWVDTSSAFGPSGIILGAGLGVVHVFYLDASVKPNVVPADIVNNSTIVAAWETAQRRNNGDQLPMIYTVSSSRNNFSFGAMESELHRNGQTIATTKAIWYNYAILTKHKLLYTILSILLHYIPAYIMDAVRVLLGKPRILVKVYKKVDKFAFALSYFTTSQWTFKDDNLQTLFRKMSPTDKLMFDMDITSVDYRTKIFFWCLGVRKYLVKDPEESMKRALRKQKIFKIIHYIISILILYLMWKVIKFCFNFFFSGNHNLS